MKKQKSEIENPEEKISSQIKQDEEVIPKSAFDALKKQKAFLVALLLLSALVIMYLLYAMGGLVDKYNACVTIQNAAKQFTSIVG